ncbi:MAG: hypothetical protein V5A23_07260 [Halobacteriales archaeon]
MDRRAFLGRAGGALAVAAAGGVAGCLGGERTDTPRETYTFETTTPTETPALVSDGFDWSSPQPETLSVSVTVRNRSDEPRTATVTATVAFGEEPSEQTKTVELGAEATETVTFSFDRPADAGPPSIEFDISEAD